MSGAVRIWSAFLLALAILAAPQLSARAAAHASLTGSEPPDRAVVAAAPERVVLTFNEPVAALTLRLVLPGGETRELSEAAADGNALRVSLPAGLGRGTHLLSWRVVSTDAHPVGGSLTFSIGEPSLEPHELARQRADGVRQTAIWAARLGLYLGLLFGCGGAFYAAWIARRPLSGVPRRLAAASLGIGFACALLSVGLQGVDAYDAPLAQLRDTSLWLQGLSSPFGRTALIALGATGAASLSLIARRGVRPLALIALAGAGSALAASGHASAAAPQFLTRPMVFIHGAAVAFWLGALIPLAAALKRGAEGRSELAAFSRVIPFAVAVLALSGVALAAIQLREPAALWTTPYGWILCWKLALVVALLGLATLNRTRLTPRIADGNPRAAQAMRRSIGAELVLALAVLTLVAGWRFTPPPRSLLDAAAAPVHVHIHTGRAMADLRFDPTRDGVRAVQITLLDGEFGPLAAKELTLLLSRPYAGVEPLRFPARHLEETIWRVPNVSLPVAGRWRVGLEILIDDFTRVAIEDEVELPR